MLPVAEKTMRILVMKTNIETLSQKDLVLQRLFTHPQVQDASVDMEDIDRVLRVVGELEVAELIDFISSQEISCTELE